MVSVVVYLYMYIHIMNMYEVLMHEYSALLLPSYLKITKGAVTQVATTSFLLCLRLYSCSG